jgi:Predicted glycosyltransferases
MVTLSIIVVNVKGKEYLPNLLESLKRSSYNDFELIIVDDEQIFGPFKLIKIEKDLGPAYCRNFASYAKGEYLLFLDNDTELLPDTIFKAVEFIKQNQNTIVQLKLVYSNGLIDSCGGVLDELGYPIELGRGGKSEENCFEVREILYAKGASLLVSKKIFDDLEGFDTNYFFGYEDTDFSFRALKRGYKVIFFPATVIHHEHGSFPKDLRSREIRLTYFLESRRLYFLLKNFSRGYLFRKMPKVLFYFFGSMLMDLVKRRKPYLFKARVKALLWVISKLPEIYRKRKNEIFIDEEKLIRRGLIVKHQLKR